MLIRNENPNICGSGGKRFNGVDTVQVVYPTIKVLSDPYVTDAQYMPSKQETLTHYWFAVGTPSLTLHPTVSQHCVNVCLLGGTYRLCSIP